MVMMYVQVGRTNKMQLVVNEPCRLYINCYVPIYTWFINGVEPVNTMFTRIAQFNDTNTNQACGQSELHLVVL